MSDQLTRRTPWHSSSKSSVFWAFPQRGIEGGAGRTRTNNPAVKNAVRVRPARAKADSATAELAEAARAFAAQLRRKGAAKPDISSADAFKRSMLAARSITYPDPDGGGASGIYMASLLERLGSPGEMKTKLS